ncbi:type II toxin-antitoxin system RelE/ParE family toxin [Candidatus Dependentiae bacterium]|nr:type II toxin-antitoxin system RelE/ParE family toxin [Candidatus Dependentiae bacterium]
MNIVQTTEFKKQVKKLHRNQKHQLDEAIKAISKDPLMGIPKKGDLSGVRVYKFTMIDQLTLLAYQFNTTQIQLILLALGTHENFYRDLKK